jgi:hypothetical protein
MICPQVKTRFTSGMAHRDISLRRGIRSLSRHSATSSKPQQSSSIYVDKPWIIKGIPESAKKWHHTPGV